MYNIQTTTPRNFSKKINTLQTRQMHLTRRTLNFGFQTSILVYNVFLWNQHSTLLDWGPQLQWMTFRPHYKGVTMKIRTITIKSLVFLAKRELWPCSLCSSHLFSHSLSKLIWTCTISEWSLHTSIDIHLCLVCKLHLHLDVGGVHCKLTVVKKGEKPKIKEVRCGERA
jgi:hypothetical protein